MNPSWDDRFVNWNGHDYLAVSLSAVLTVIWLAGASGGNAHWLVIVVVAALLWPFVTLVVAVLYIAAFFAIAITLLILECTLSALNFIRSHKSS